MGVSVARYVFIALSIAVFIAVPPIRTDAIQKLGPTEIAFLRNAAQEQLAEIGLGRLAVKKASDKKVKEVGTEILEDHEYASQELKDLSATVRIYLPVEMNDQQKKAQQRLSHLSGNEFDKAFIAYMLKKHRKQVEELQKNALKLHNDNVKQWAQATEPILEVHLKKMEHVAEALGMDEDK
jgi:putative membrane protein